MFDSGVGGFGISAQLSGTETDCALIDLMSDLHSCEAMLVERARGRLWWRSFSPVVVPSMSRAARGRRRRMSWRNPRLVRC